MRALTDSPPFPLLFAVSAAVFLPSHLPRIVTTGLLFMAGAFATPSEAASALKTSSSARLPLLLAQRSVDVLDDEREARGQGLDPGQGESAVLHEGGAGHIVNRVIPGVSPGVPVVKDPSPAVPTLLPAVPAVLPKRTGSEPRGEGGALVTRSPPGNARELRLQMREYGDRYGDGKATPRLLRETGGDVRWLDGDERILFREALRERHHRPRH